MVTVPGADSCPNVNCRDKVPSSTAHSRKLSWGESSAVESSTEEELSPSFDDAGVGDLGVSSITLNCMQTWTST